MDRSPEIVAWCDSIVGQPYDIIGAVDSGIGLALHLANHWFCSEVAEEILSRAGAIGVPMLACPAVLEMWADTYLSRYTRYAGMDTGMRSTI